MTYTITPVIRNYVSVLMTWFLLLVNSVRKHVIEGVVTTEKQELPNL